MTMHRQLPDAEIEIFKNSSHTPFWEEPEAYFARLSAFLAKHRSKARKGKGRRGR